MLEANPGSNNLKRPLKLVIRKDLLDPQEAEIVNNVDRCLNINIKIQGVKTGALIETGSEITCISKSFFGNH